MRRSTVFLCYLFFLLSLGVAMLVHASSRRELAAAALQAQRAMVRNMELTDLCLFTEANYTRHLSQSDLHTPFQDGPSALEHFPSGGLLRPPHRRTKTNEELD